MRYITTALILLTFLIVSGNAQKISNRIVYVSGPPAVCVRGYIYVDEVAGAVYVWKSGTGCSIVSGGGGGTGLLTLNGLTADPQTFAIGTTGTNFNIVSSGSTHTFNFPDASASNRGLLTSANWATFNSKIGSLGGLTATSQTFAKVDDTNITLSIGSATSTHTFTLGWTGTLAKARQNVSTAYIDQANTFGAFTQTFGGLVNATQFQANGAVTGIQIGDVGASRSATTGAYFLGTDGNGFLFRSAANTLHLGGTNLLIFNVATSSFPALKRNAANLQVRLADDSAFSNLEVLDEAYNTTNWDGSIVVPTKNAVRDLIEGGVPLATTASSGDSATAFFSSGNLEKAVQHASTVYFDQTNSWGDGIRQTFNPNGTTPGFNFGSQAGDPSTPINGDCWYNSTTEKYRCHENGSTTNMIGGAGGGTPGGSDTQLQRNNAGAFGGITGATSNGANVTFGSGNLLATSPRITTSLDDSNGNELFKFTATSSAVNEFTIVNAATTGAPQIQATGADADINISLLPKGTGTVVAPSFETNGAASGAFDMSGSTSGTVTQTVAAVAGTWTFIWPTTAGTTGQCLQTTTSGTTATTAWAACGGGGGSTNPTSTLLPYNNAGTFADSNLTHVSAGVRIPNTKYLVGRNAANSADFNIIGIDANNRAAVPDLQLALGDGLRDNASFPNFLLSGARWDWAADGEIRWSNDVNDVTATKDLGILRHAAGVARITEGGTGVGALNFKRQLQDKTTSYTVTVNESGGVLTNTGAAGGITFTLPTPVIGLTYTFVTGAAQALSITTTTPASEEIIDGGTVDANDILASAATRGISVTVIAISSTSWVVIAKTGTWS